MQATEMPALMQDYIDAFGARDLTRCVALFDDNASLEFGPATYQGKQALESWHKTRFDANLQLVRIDNVKVEDDTITVEGVITSKRLKAWRLNTLSGRATFKVHNGKIATAQFGMRNYNPLEAFRR